MATFQNVFSENYYLRGELLDFSSTSNSSPGLQGERGLTGDKGVSGEQGLRGLQGDAGLRGLQGIQGLIGIQGAKGETTVIHDDGKTTYVKGDDGSQGIQGSQGVQGDRGMTGLTGQIGQTGSQGLRGDAGVAGVAGIQGLTGAEGKQGPQGVPGIATVIHDVDGKTSTITGAAGVNGKDGIVSFKSIRVLEGQFEIILPSLESVTESGLYYYKDSDHTETDTTFKLSNGLIVGKFYHHRIQNITFFKGNNTWIN
jgi:hypothetical protein